jgi:glutamyl-tRNA synthetase
LPYFTDLPAGVDAHALARALQPRIETLVQIAEQIAFVKEVPAYSEELYVNKKMKTDVEVAKKALALAYPVLEKLDVWTNESLFECMKTVAVDNELKNGQVLYPVRIALTGLETTPGGASEIASVLGKEETLRRLKLAM